MKEGEKIGCFNFSPSSLSRKNVTTRHSFNFGDKSAQRVLDFRSEKYFLFVYDYTDMQ
jgi:hypothetical protein